jgi:hypothetical protein
VGISGEAQQKQVLAGLERRYHECVCEKNCTLIRFDIIQTFRTLFEHTPKEAIKEKALALIELETDAKYRKKYAGLWKGS